MGTAKTACVECRKVKTKCCRRDGMPRCIRCTQNELLCAVVPRRLGRQPGSKNRPKNMGDSIRLRQRRAEQRATLRPESRAETASFSLSPELPHSGDSGTDTPRARASSASFNMLSVLARVANDQQPPTEPTPPSTSSEPFDRSRFLSEFLHEASSLDPDLYGGVAVLEAGLGELYKGSRGSPEGFGKDDEVVHSRIDQPRIDVLPQYDVVGCGLVSEVELGNLLQVYWERIQPVGRVLDPEIHTEAYLRAQSATLTSVVLVIAAQSLPVSEHANSLVARLDEHVDFLLAETARQGFQSIEICQALTLLCLFIGGDQLRRTWALTAKVLAIAVELRLDVSPPPPWALAPSPHHSASPMSLARNVERLWILLIDWDRACAFIRGRRPMIRQPPNADAAQLLEWARHLEALGSDAKTGGCCVLLEVVSRLQFTAGRQLVQQGSSFDFEAHHQTVNRELDLSDTRRGPAPRRARRRGHAPDPAHDAVRVRGAARVAAVGSVRGA